MRQTEPADLSTGQEMGRTWSVSPFWQYLIDGGMLHSVRKTGLFEKEANRGQLTAALCARPAAQRAQLRSARLSA